MSEELDAAYEAAAAAIGRADALLVTTHESPDGDAIGSLLAAELALSRAGHDVATFIGGTGRFPRELRWLGTDAIARVAPEDAARRTLLALDCGSARRIGDGEALLRRVAGSVNVDHHHDNTRFADVDVVDPSAACTTMMLARLLDALGRPLEADVATRLYVGLVTDTGRFAYANTDAAALRLAARLVETGARPATVFRELYEKTPLAKGRLLARGLERVESLLDGRLLLTSLTRADFAETGAEDADSDGIIDHLRTGVEGLAALLEPGGRRVARGARRGWRRTRPGGRLLERPAVRRAEGLHRPGARCPWPLSRVPRRRPDCSSWTRRRDRRPSRPSRRYARSSAARSATRARSTPSRPA